VTAMVSECGYCRLFHFQKVLVRMRVDLNGDERSAAIMCINCLFKGGSEWSCVDLCMHRPD